MRLYCVAFAALLSLSIQSIAQQVRRAAPVTAKAAPRASVVNPPEIAGQSAVFRSGDTFELSLGGAPLEYTTELRNQYTIGGDGYINVPYAGQIRAAGLTQSQLERAIEQRLIAEKMFRFPTITINVGAQARFVTIGGQVRAPGRQPWTPDLTLLAALAAAGGPSEFGGDKVRLTRNSEVSQYSIKRLKRNPKEDPRLFPGDQVEQL